VVPESLPPGAFVCGRCGLLHEDRCCEEDELALDSRKKKWRWTVDVIEPTNYTKLSKKIIHRTDDLANLSPYNPVVREITTDFKPTYIPAKIVISLAVTITNYIKVHIADTSEFKHSYYKPSSNKSSGSI
jgi:hypothetical protein